MEFMSPEHVAAMNDVLEQSEDVRAACAGIGRPSVLAFRLSDGPGGADVHWTMIFHDRMRFSLDKHPSPDVLITGDWKRMILATAAGRRGEVLDPGVEITGDQQLLMRLNQILDLGRRVATFEVSFPAVEGVSHPGPSGQGGA
jgi:hypothetical protein